MIKTCPVCDEGKLTRKVVPYEIHGNKLGEFPAMVCSGCSEQWFDEETVLKIEQLEKEKGLFGLSVKSKISYAGNSLIVRIPKQIAEFMNIKKEENIIMHPEGKNKLAIELA